MSVIVAQILGGMIGIFLGVMLLLFVVFPLRERKQLREHEERAQLWQERVHTENDMPAPVYGLDGRRVR